MSRIQKNPRCFSTYFVFRDFATSICVPLQITVCSVEWRCRRNYSNVVFSTAYVFFFFFLQRSRSLVFFYHSPFVICQTGKKTTKHCALQQILCSTLLQWPRNNLRDTLSQLLPTKTLNSLFDLSTIRGHLDHISFSSKLAKQTTLARMNFKQLTN